VKYFEYVEVSGDHGKHYWQLWHTPGGGMGEPVGPRWGPFLTMHDAMRDANRTNKRPPSGIRGADDNQ
jgi:hypothetical protein